MGQLAPVNVLVFRIYYGPFTPASLVCQVLITSSHFSAQQISHRLTMFFFVERKPKKFTLQNEQALTQAFYIKELTQALAGMLFCKQFFFLLVDRKTSVMYTVFICKRCNESTLHQGQDILCPLPQQAPPYLTIVHASRYSTCCILGCTWRAQSHPKVAQGFAPPPECHMPRGKFFSALSFAQSGKKGRERYGKHQQQEEETSCTGGYKYITVILL